MELTADFIGATVMHVCVNGGERDGERKRGRERGCANRLTGSLTAMESNGAGRAESITGHNRFSHRSELGKGVLYCSTDSWHRVSAGKGAGSKNF